jgi:hypothetical protein
MTISRRKLLGATAVVSGLAWGGVESFGQRSGLGGSHTSVAKEAPIGLAEGNKSDSAQAARGLAEVLKRHPARLGADRRWGYQIYMMDLVDGGTTLVVDEPVQDRVASGMPRWSHDGTRIVFDTNDQWPLARLMAIAVRDGRPNFTELGAGNNPTVSPDDKRIAFLLYPGAEPGAEPGIWIMQADGSGRRRLGELFGAPFWSPDGREFLINSYSLPTDSTVINLQTKEGGIIAVSGHQIFSWPSWVGPGTVVSALATNGEGNSIALLDVRKPAHAKIIEVLWKRGKDLDVTPRWPVFRPGTRECFFVGEEPERRMLYTLKRGESLRARRIEQIVERTRPGQHQQLSGLTFSPDGRYLLFQANRPEMK